MSLIIIAGLASDRGAVIVKLGHSMSVHVEGPIWMKSGALHLWRAGRWSMRRVDDRRDGGDNRPPASAGLLSPPAAWSVGAPDAANGQGLLWSASSLREDLTGIGGEGVNYASGKIDWGLENTVEKDRNTGAHDTTYNQDAMNPSRGLLNGVGVSLVIWASIAIIAKTL